MSHDAAASDARSQEGTTRGKYWWLRWVIIGVAVVVLAVEVTLVWDQLAKAWHSLYAAKWWWVLAAVAAAMASMHSFAQIQRTLLKSAGVKVKQWRSEAAFYAGNALSTTHARVARCCRPRSSTASSGSGVRHLWWRRGSW